MGTVAAPPLDRLVPEMVAVRRDIHAHPELSWAETRTSALVGRRLRQRGLEPEVLPTGTGLTCDVVGDPEGPMVALRADLDALPLDDESPGPWRSVVPGVAHACGHDIHTAVVLGAGLALAELVRTGAFRGRARLIFQPAEEVVPGGALAAIEAGVLDGVSSIFALHCDPGVPSGHVAIRAGAITGATDMVTVRLSGPGGHTARPHLTTDLVGALAEVVARSPGLLARRSDARAALSLVWGQISAGSAANVIPERGEASGTVRSLDPVVWELAESVVPDLLRDLVRPYGAHIEVDYTRGVPPAVNDDRCTRILHNAVAAALAPERIREAPQSAGAEDFAWFLRRVPGALGRLGVRRPGSHGGADLHQPTFDPDEAAIGAGMSVLTRCTLDAVRAELVGGAG